MKACVDAVRTPWPQPPPGCLRPRLVLCGLAWVAPPTARLTCRIIVAPEDPGATAHRPLHIGAERSGARVPHALALPCEVLAHCFDDTRKRTTPARLVAAGSHDRSCHP